MPGIEAMSITWPAALLLSVLIACTTALVWKGLIPSHALYAIGGAIVGWIVPRGAAREGRAARDSGNGRFSPEEIPTKRDVLEAARKGQVPK